MTGTVTLVSRNSSGSGGNGNSDYPSITPNGRYVAFDSTSSDLVASDTNGGTKDVFVRDMQTGTEVVSRSSGGVQGNGESYRASVSDDGNRIAFNSLATNLATDGNSARDVFLRDRSAVTTELVSIRSNASCCTGSTDAYYPQFNTAEAGRQAISGDGRYVTFMGEWGAGALYTDRCTGTRPCPIWAARRRTSRIRPTTTTDN